MSKITIQCRLVASEATRQYLWHLMADIYTPFVNEMLRQIREDDNFEQWRQAGKIPAGVFENYRKALKTESRFQGMPGRWYYAGREEVKRIYKSWLALRRRLRNQLSGQNRWLEVLQSDETLMAVSGLDLPALRAESTKLMDLLSSQIAKPAKDSKKTNRKKGKKQAKQTQGKSLYQALWDLYQETEDILQKCAIAYLLKNKSQVPDKPEDLEKFQHRRRKAEIRTERINEQLTKSRLPKGRDLTDEQWLEALAIATEQIPKDETEAAIWQSRLLTDADSLPFPVAYETNEDLKWFLNGKGRLCVSFNGLSEHTFEIYCDQRQLHWFQRFLEDQQIKKDNKGERSSSLFTLRSGRILWKPHSEASKSTPWTANHLTLQCSVDTRLWTAEGTEQVRQEKATSIAKIVAGTKAKGNLNQKQQDFITKREKTLELLQNPFPRPSQPLYRGNPSIIAAVSFGLEKPATLAIVDIVTSKAITYRSIRQLLGQNYSLFTKHRLKQQQRAHQRHQNQKESAENRISEGGLGEHVDSLIAKAILETATEYGASSVVLPELGNIREIIHAEIQAKAERKIPGLKEKQDEYAAKFRASVHRWSYGRLAQKITTKASLQGLETESIRQPLQGTSQEKARNLAIAAYESRTVVQRA
ncbi:type V CRISPR-associated protein Cas12k [Halomicronema sp. CCY15110]|uniref:type V CRISPR-associated protein Cas12k n=1 Tax=Halomicronema sp. CCY15110 TaxID=2767773 RepID=UPI00194E8C8D|nr:type V CRISPR-associated protein Cas12k [Halomicronema sp. CCY15110]